jgi:hypothetical protein
MIRAASALMAAVTGFAIACSSRAPRHETPENQAPVALVDAAVAGLPAEVTKLVSRWQECWHWAGEEPYDADRRQQIADGVAGSCPGNEEERDRLRAKYRERQDVLDALSKLDEMQ